MKRGWLVLHYGKVTLRLDRRVPRVLLVLVSILTTGVLLSLTQGEYPIPMVEVVETLLGLGTVDADHDFVIHTLRLPRTLIALLAGMGLGVSGAILQGLTRNPLADPGIIGVTAGASLAAVSSLVLLPGLPLWGLPVAAFAGGGVISLLIYLLAWDQGSSPIRLILVGVGISSFIAAITSLMVALGNINSVTEALVWLAGSVYGRGWESVFPLLPWIATFIPTAWILAPHLNALNYGDDVARGLGSRVEWLRGGLLATSAALAGSVVAMVGTIGFVGLMAPHLSRRLVGPTHEGLILTTALTGGILVVWADWLGRWVFAPVELPCGVITSVIGAPYFLFLLYRSQRA